MSTLTGPLANPGPAGLHRDGAAGPLPRLAVLDTDLGPGRPETVAGTLEPDEEEPATRSSAWSVFPGCRPESGLARVLIDSATAVTIPARRASPRATAMPRQMDRDLWAIDVSLATGSRDGALSGLAGLARGCDGCDTRLGSLKASHARTASRCSRI